MMGVAARSWLVILCAAVIAGCNQPEVKRDVKPPIVTWAHPIERKVRDFAEATGRTAAVESVQVRARVSGYLQKINFKEGDEVKKDQVLFEIDPRPFKAALDQSLADVKMREAQVNEAKSAYDREFKLRKTGASSEEELEKALRSWSVATAAVEAAKAAVESKQLNLDYTKVLSPVAGRVDKANITVGNLVAADVSATVLTSVVSEQPMYAYFDVDERTVLMIRERIRQGSLKPREEEPREVLLGLGTGSDYPFKGVIDFVSNQVNTSTGTLQVRGKFANEDKTLLPGLFARVRVMLGDAHPAILVNEYAIIRNQGKSFLFLVSDQNEVVIRQVELGELRDGLREIKHGVSVNDRVIVNGLQRVSPGKVVDPKPGEMDPRQPDITSPAVEKAKAGH